MNKQEGEEIDTGRPEIHIAQIEMSSMDSIDSHIPQFVDRIITWSRLVKWILDSITLKIWTRSNRVLWSVVIIENGDWKMSR